MEKGPATDYEARPRSNVPNCKISSTEDLVFPGR